MTWKAQIAGTAIVMFLACFVAGAQMRGGGSSGVSIPFRAAPARVTSMVRQPGVSAAPSTSGARASRQPTVIQVSPNGRVISNPSSFANSFNDDGIGVPGLGFDYVHLAAISGNFRNNGNSFGQDSHRRGNFITPIFFGGFPYYSDSPDYQPGPQPPQIIVIQQPAPAVTAQQESPAAQQGAYDVPTPAPAPAPVPEVGELILVRRDGRVLFASVFSVIGNQVQYVTPEGIRHTLPLTELDTVATQEMNEARGTTLQFHN